VRTLTYTLEGERLTLWESGRPLILGAAGSPTLSVRVAGLLSNLYRERGDTELADLLWTARAHWAQTPEGQSAAIVGRPVWGLGAGAGICEGCEEDCGPTERHYYSLPHTGTVGLCLDCGPEEHYSELTH
jgi:hypothetical protein